MPTARARAALEIRASATSSLTRARSISSSVGGAVGEGPGVRGCGIFGTEPPYSREVADSAVRSDLMGDPRDSFVRALILRIMRRHDNDVSSHERLRHRRGPRRSRGPRRARAARAAHRPGHDVPHAEHRSRRQRHTTRWRRASGLTARRPWSTSDCGTRASTVSSVPWRHSRGQSRRWRSPAAWRPSPRRCSRAWRPASHTSSLCVRSTAGRTTCWQRACSGRRSPGPRRTRSARPFARTPAWCCSRRRPTPRSTSSTSPRWWRRPAACRCRGQHVRDTGAPAAHAPGGDARPALRDEVHGRPRGRHGRGRRRGPRLDRPPPPAAGHHRGGPAPAGRL